MPQKQRPITPQDVLAFLGLSCLLVVSQFLSLYAGEFIEGFIKERRVWAPGWTAGISFLVLCGVVWAAYTMTRSMPRPGIGRQALICVIAFIVLVLSNASPTWFAEAVGLEGATLFLRSTIFFVLLVAWVFLWHRMLPTIRQWFETPVNLAVGKNTQPPAGPVTLIAIVSRIKREEFKLSSQPSAAVLSRGDGYLLRFSSLEQDIQSLAGSNWPWQQLLRAVSRYAPRANLKIILVGSKPDGPDEEGSHAQLADICKPFLERYHEVPVGTVEIFPHALDFEDFNDVKDKVRDCICREYRRVGEGNVFVDITGGQKIASAAAAAATIGTMGQFQYVRTNVPKEKQTDQSNVIVSDLHPQAVPAAGN